MNEYVFDDERELIWGELMLIGIQITQKIRHNFILNIQIGEFWCLKKAC